jgi:uncharacterized Zn-binding protein involved in type VI secretion
MGTALADIDSDVDQHLASQPAPPSSSAPAGGGGGPGGAPASAPATTPAPATPASTGPAADLGVSANWWKGMNESVTNLVHPPPPQPNAQTGRMPTQAQQAVARARAAQTVVSNALGAIGMVGDTINAGFANLTNPIAKVLPAFPAATITMMYLGLPHTHNHPPSLIPPAPPVPLPSIGAIMLGTSVKVLINGMPAARCGDIGLAPTCCGLTPFFQIKTGSSNTFIGGNRAARMLDICQACAEADKREEGIDAGKIMGAIGAAARGIQTAQKAMGYVAIAMDAAEAAVEDDAAMQTAKAMAAAMGAAQMAADKAAEALTKTMGKDPAGIPPKVIGAITLGHPNVLIGGFPMINIPNPAELLLKRLARYKYKKPAPEGDAQGTGSCPG